MPKIIKGIAFKDAINKADADAQYDLNQGHRSKWGHIGIGNTGYLNAVGAE